MWVHPLRDTLQEGSTTKHSWERTTRAVSRLPEHIHDDGGENILHVRVHWLHYLARRRSPAPGTRRERHDPGRRGGHCGQPFWW